MSRRVTVISGRINPKPFTTAREYCPIIFQEIDDFYLMRESGIGKFLELFSRIPQYVMCRISPFSERDQLVMLQRMVASDIKLI